MTSGAPPSAGSDPDRFRLRAVIGVTFIIMFGFGLVVPTLPLFASSFGVAEAGVGLLLTAFAGARLAASLFTGSVLTRFGEPRTAALGAAIVGASSLSAGFATSYLMLVMLRGLGGVGSAFFIGALTSSILGGVAPDRRGRAMAAFQGAVVTGFILGPAVGGLIGQISLRAPLYVYGAVCLGCSPLLLAVMRTGTRVALDQPDTIPGPIRGEENAPPPSIPAWQRLRPLLSDSAYVGALATGWATFFVAGGVDTLFSRTWRLTLGQTAASVGIPFMANALAGLVPTFHAGRLADARGRKFATVPALALSIPVLIGIGLVRTPVPFVALAAVLGVTWAYQRPGTSAIVGDVTTDETRGAAVGALRISQDVGALIGPILVGGVAESLGRSAGYVVVAGGVAVALVFMMRARETHGAKAVPR